MIKVGCCGYPVSIIKYQENFHLIELNKTFYDYPKISTVVKWRENAPKGFEFAVKAHQDISHKFKLNTESSASTFGQMKQVCSLLAAKILLIQTPSSFRPDNLGDAEEFFDRMHRDDLILAWETRGSLWEQKDAYQRLSKILETVDVVHVTDPFKVMPAYTNAVAYFRLHGLGERMYDYQYSNKELQKLYEIAKSFEDKGKEVYVLFNNLAMFDDALRFRRYIKCGKLPSLTKAIGIESVKEVIEGIKFPTTKTSIFKAVGWKLVESEDGKQVRIDELLKDMPLKTYNSVDEVLQEVRFH
jgi:uncharacterized protein YecE (DUF72 family)